MNLGGYYRTKEVRFFTALVQSNGNGGDVVYWGDRGIPENQITDKYMREALGLPVVRESVLTGIDQNGGNGQH